jgi:hypothetical protein
MFKEEAFTKTVCRRSRARSAVILNLSSLIVFSRLKGSASHMTQMTQKRMKKKAITARAPTMKRTRSIIRRRSKSTSS